MDLKELIERGETQSLEFKESLRLKDEIGETVSAFSNSDGGTVIVGVSNSGGVHGVDIGKNTLEEFANYIKRNTDPQIFPSVKILEIGGKNVVMVEVEESREKPVFFKNHAYKRVGKTNQMISSSELRKLAKESGERVYWDEQICKEARLENIDWGFVKNFFIPGYEKFSERRIIGTAEELLEALSCIKEGKPTNAGILLFGENPQYFFRNSYIALARYKGKMEGVERLDYKEFFGNLFHQIDECDKYIKEHIAIMSRLLPHKVEREDIPEYCWFSIRELVTNAVCHRDYEDQGSKVIAKIFSDRIEFYLRRNERITNMVYREINKTTKKTATRDLQELVRSGILIKSGRTGRGVYYRLNPTYKGDIRRHKGTRNM